MPELDGLKGIAILAVVIWHASLRAARQFDSVSSSPEGSLYRMVPHGEIGVLIFFVVSGFIVSLPFVDKPWTLAAAGRFYGRRALRIYPPYLVVMGGAALMLGLSGHTPSGARSFEASRIGLADSFLASLPFAHGLLFNAPSRLNPPMWSLEIEIAFYAVLPFIMLLLQRARTKAVRIAVLTIAVLGSVGALSALPLLDQDTGRFRFGLIFYGYYFLLGIAMAIALGTSVGTLRKHPLYDAAFASALVLLLACGIELTSLDARLPQSATSVLLRVALAGSLVVVLASAFLGRAASRFLSHPWLGLIGTACYSIYLTHVPVIQVMSELLARFVHSADASVIWAFWFAVLIPGALGCGLLFYVAVERPFVRLASSPEKLGRLKAAAVAAFRHRTGHGEAPDGPAVCPSLGSEPGR